MTEIVLAEALDMRAAAPLLTEIKAARGAELQLDASKVERLGGQCLQILLAAEQAWSADGHTFQFGNASTAFKDGWVLMGAEALAPLASLEIAQ